MRNGSKNANFCAFMAVLKKKTMFKSWKLDVILENSWF